MLNYFFIASLSRFEKSNRILISIKITPTYFIQLDKMLPVFGRFTPAFKGRDVRSGNLDVSTTKISFLFPSFSGVTDSAGGL